MIRLVGGWCCDALLSLSQFLLRFALVLALVGTAASVHSQRAGVDVFGSPIPGITAHGHHAIGINPALLAAERPFQDRWTPASYPDSLNLNRRDKKRWRKAQRSRFFSGFEGALTVNTPLMDGTPLFRRMGGDDWTLAERRKVAEEWSQGPTMADAQLRWAGWSRHGRKGGWAWSLEDRYQASLQPNAALTNFVMLGPASSVYDRVQLMDGTTVAVDSITDEQYAQADFGIRDGDALLAMELFQDSRFAVQHVRAYGVGFGLKLIDSRPLVVSAGMAARYYRGTGYYEVDAQEGTAFAAFNRGFGAELVSQDATLGSALRPAGFGVAVDVAARVDVAGLWFVSMAITEVGSMDWRGERYQLDNPISGIEDWASEGGGAFELLNQGLAPASLFLSAIPERRVVQLPTRVRLNGGMRIGQRGLIGIELAAPMNQAILRQPTEMGVGARSQWGPLMVMGGFRLQEGRGWQSPAAVVWAPKDRASQFGLATEDASAWFASDKRWGWGWSYTRTLIPARGLEGRK